MKQLLCPLNGLKNISEFTYGGEVEIMPDATKASEKEWAHYLYYHQNNLGIVREWWCHSATSYWFIAERHTQTDEIVKTYPADKIFSKRVDF